MRFAQRLRGLLRRLRSSQRSSEEVDLDTGSERVMVGGEPFLVWPNIWNAPEHAEDGDAQVVFKSVRMVRRYLELAAAGDHPNVVELGIYQGGSTAFLYRAFRAECVVAFDLETEPAPALEQYIDEHGLRDRVHTHYGVDQSDTATVLRLLAADVGDSPIDFVVDDASHFYAPTRASFEALFPRLREGGEFVIEDWAWSHADADSWQEDGGIYPDQPAPTNLLVEIVMLSGTRPDIVREVRVDRSVIEVVRGEAPLDAPMDMAALTRNRGKAFQPFL